MRAGSSETTGSTNALADLFSCVGSGDIPTAKALLDAHTEDGRRSLLSATNPAGITLLQQACHAGRADGVSMLLEKVRRCCVCLKGGGALTCWIGSLPSTQVNTREGSIFAQF